MKTAESLAVHCETWVAGFERRLQCAEALIAVLSLTLLLVLSVGEIIARDAFQRVLPGVDTLTRYLVLLVGFLGAVLAGHDRHLKVDLASLWLSDRARDRLTRPVAGISALVCGALSVAAWRFWREEWRYAVGPGRETALLEIIIPAGLLLLSLHFSLRLLAPRTLPRP